MPQQKIINIIDPLGNFLFWFFPFNSKKIKGKTSPFLHKTFGKSLLGVLFLCSVLFFSCLSFCLTEINKQLIFFSYNKRMRTRNNKKRNITRKKLKSSEKEKKKKFRIFFYFFSFSLMSLLIFFFFKGLASLISSIEKPNPKLTPSVDKWLGTETVFLPNRQHKLWQNEIVETPEPPGKK